MGAYSDDLLFLHIPKCGGDAVKRYLKEHIDGMCIPGDDGYQFPIGHIRLRDVEEYLGRPPESFKTILATVRNPYDQQLSQWRFWADRFARYRQHELDIVAQRYGRLGDFLLDVDCDFHRWYELNIRGGLGEITTATPANLYLGFGGQYRFFLDVDGKIPKNVRVVRLEELDKHLPHILAPFTNATLPPVPVTNKGPGLSNDTADYYTRLAVRLVEAKSRWAFEEFYERWQ